MNAPLVSISTLYFHLLWSGITSQLPQTISQMSDPLSIASGIAGLVTHADAVFSNVYQYAKAVKNAEKEIKELVATIQSLSGLLHSLA